MKIKIILTVLIIGSVAIAQNIYDVTPGTKGNQIQFTVANISEVNPAGIVSVRVLNDVPSVNFKNDTETVENIEPNQEKEITFLFDINRDTPVNLPDGKAGKKDTVNFMISDQNGLALMKSIILNFIPPKEFKLEQNFPNPFNPTTTIQYQLPTDSKVTLKVYDILGAEVMTLVDEDQEAGYKEVKFNAGNIASGMYIYRLQVENPDASRTNKFSSTKKMMVLK